MQKVLIKIKNSGIKNLFNIIFNKRVIRFTYLGRCKLNKMSEYNFELCEFNIMLEDFSNYTVFIKRISKEEVKETLFCYWQFCEENYNLHGNFYQNKANLRNIGFKEVPEYFQKYSLQLLSKNNKIWKVSDINIIDLRKIKKQMKNRELDNEKYKSNRIDYSNNTKEYIFIGII